MVNDLRLSIALKPATETVDEVINRFLTEQRYSDSALIAAQFVKDNLPKLG